MFDQVIFLLVGLTLLLVSVDRMIEYSDRIAKYFQISPILIGLTLVAFGTSAPELVITLFASFNNPPNTDAIIGNVIGSNIAIFDPITFPIIASVFGGLLNEANNVITSSGAEVPKATRVRPISIGEI